MRKLSRRRAVSTVLSTILLIVIVVIGMSIAFTFFIGYVSDFQAGRGSSAMELVEIEDIWFQTEGSIEVWLYNYGKISVRITSVYIDGRLVDFTPSIVDVSVGNHTYMTLNLPRGWSPATTYSFKLATERGSAFEREYVSPNVLR